MLQILHLNREHNHLCFISGAEEVDEPFADFRECLCCILDCFREGFGLQAFGEACDIRITGPAVDIELQTKKKIC